MPFSPRTLMWQRCLQFFTKFSGPVLVTLLVMGSFLVSNLAYTCAEEVLEEPQTKANSIHSRVKKEQTVPNRFTRFFLKQYDYMYAFDTSPLGTRTPVILVPGRAEEYQFGVWWKKFNVVANQTPSFKEKYKLYLYLYDSTEKRGRLSQDFLRELNKHFANLPPEQKYILVTYSLGGLIGYDVMQDPAIFNRVDKVFAIAVPFHGSPLFSRNWYVNHLRPPNPSPIRKVMEKALYQYYMAHKGNLIEQLRWNDFDQSHPLTYAKGKRKIESPWKPYTAEEQEYIRAYKTKLIIHASYLENNYTRPKEAKNSLPLPTPADLIKLPGRVIGTVLPNYIYSPNSVMRYTNRQLAELPSRTAEKPEGEFINLFRYNDGAIPLSSALFLPPRETPYNLDLEGFVQASNAYKTRIFPEANHIDYGALSHILMPYGVSDATHPAEGKRTPIEWVIYDIMQDGQKPAAINTPERAIHYHSNISFSH